MRFSIFAFFMSLILSSNSQATVQTAQCDSVMGTGRLLQLIFQAETLKQIRVVSGGRVVPLIPVPLQQQSDPSLTVYSIMGSSELFQMDNSVSIDGTGHVSFSSDRFSCN